MIFTKRFFVQNNGGNMMYAPIVMFVYNRADHFQKTYEALAKCPEAKESLLYVFSDGPKNDNAEEAVKTVRNAVKEIASNGDFKDVILTESLENKGLARSVIAGVSKVIKEHKKVIVVEDDCVPSELFLKYMNNALEFYKDVKEVGSIAGYAPPINIPDEYKKDVYAAYRSCSWGWATWDFIWDKVDWELRFMSDFYNDKKLIRKLNSFGSDRFMRLYRQTVSNANSWSVKFGAHHIKENLLTIYPRYSYISNIGCDESGVHSKSEDAEKMRVDLSKAIANPKFEKVVIDKKIQKIFKKHYSAGVISDMKRYLATKYIVFKEKRK